MPVSPVPFNRIQTNRRVAEKDVERVQAEVLQIAICVSTATRKVTGKCRESVPPERRQSQSFEAIDPKHAISRARV